MKIYLKQYKGDAPAPVGGGTTRGWFLHYKWNRDDVVFVPLEFEVKNGDYLWFAMDGRVLGVAIITRCDRAMLPLGPSQPPHYEAYFRDPYDIREGDRPHVAEDHPIEVTEKEHQDWADCISVERIARIEDSEWTKEEPHAGS